MPTKQQIDKQFDQLDKYLRWLINAGYWETWEILMEVLRTDHYYIYRRKIE